jgi:hypothetical protein
MTQPIPSQAQRPDPEKSWTEFRTALNQAAIKVGKYHFQIPRYAADDAWRERAYCYELYHQLRLQLGDTFPYTLHGEIDKAGHEWVVRNFGKRSRPNPDFIVHVPKELDNLVIMEVKTSDTDNKLILSDLKKIKKFMKAAEERAHVPRKLGYRHGIMLLFGTQEPEPITGYDDIEILWHSTVGHHPAYHAGLKITPITVPSVALVPSCEHPCESVSVRGK